MDNNSIFDRMAADRAYRRITYADRDRLIAALSEYSYYVFSYYNHIGTSSVEMEMGFNCLDVDLTPGSSSIDFFNAEDEEYQSVLRFRGEVETADSFEDEGGHIVFFIKLRGDDHRYQLIAS